LRFEISIPPILFEFSSLSLKAIANITNPDAQKAYMNDKGSAVRVFYTSGTQSQSELLQKVRIRWNWSLAMSLTYRLLLKALPSKNAFLGSYYRTQFVTVAHADIPKTFGPKLLANVTCCINATLLA